MLYEIAEQYLRKAIEKHRRDKIRATQRNASREELQALEDKLHAVIWLLAEIGAKMDQEDNND